jgi:acyl carrier protein
MMQDTIISIISEVKDDATLQAKLGPTSDLIHDAGLDSLQLINFILLIEDKFEIEIDFDDFDFTHLSSIDKFCAFISERK